jgi:hypothetical protein
MLSAGINQNSACCPDGAISNKELKYEKLTEENNSGMPDTDPAPGLRKAYGNGQINRRAQLCKYHFQ